MREIRVLTPRGCLGAGPFRDEDFLSGMERNPHVIATDMGSLDPGPYYLGAGLPHQARFQTKNELSLILPLAKKHEIPFIIGTAGGSGGARHLKWTLDIINEVVKEKKLTFRLAVISSTLDKNFVKRKVKDGKIHPLGHDTDLTAGDIDSTTEIVAQIGFEPMIEAMKQGAELVICGRACDNTIAASLAISQGFDKGLSLHMGKLMECGGLVAVPSRSAGSVLSTLRDDHFLIEPLDPEMKCTVTSVGSHEGYERSNPFYQKGPGFMLDLTKTELRQHDSRTVKVSGSKFVPESPYTVKLEGAQKIGCRTIALAGIRDPFLIKSIESVLAKSKQYVIQSLEKSGFQHGRDYTLLFKIYGKNAVMGDLEPIKNATPHEIGLVVEVVASTMELAEEICHYTVTGTLAFANYEGKVATAGNLAYPYSPKTIETGDVYRLSVHHLMEIEDPLMFPITMTEIGL